MLMIWIAVVLLALSVLLFAAAAVKHHLAKELVRKAGGKWTWNVFLDPSGVVTVAINLWPRSEQDKDMLSVARGIQYTVDEERKVLRYGSIQRGFTREVFYQLLFVPQAHVDVVPEGHHRRGAGR